MIKSLLNAHVCLPLQLFMKIKVIISETLSRTVEVEARTKEEALQMIRKAYEKGEIVLDWNDFAEAEFSLD